MSMEEKNVLVEKYLNDIAKQINDKYPNLINDDKLKKAKEMFLDKPEDYEQIIEEINKKVQEMIEKQQEYQKYLKRMHQKYNDSEYKTQNIEELDITGLTYEQLDNKFFHYSWKKYLESYDKNGMKPIIGENSQGIDTKASIFFSKGIEGVLELWDVWLKWRLDRQNNPQYKGNNSEEIEETSKRYNKGDISEDERKQWYYWLEYYNNKKFLSNDELLRKLFDFQYNEMINSDYFIMDLRENEEFRYDQEDSKKRMAIENCKRFNRGISPHTLIQYGAYSDFSTTIVDKWNMQTIPGKDITVEPSRLKRLIIDGNNDVYSIMKFMYDKYKREVPTEKQIKFDLLDKYVKYVEEKKKNSIKEQQTSQQKSQELTQLEQQSSQKKSFDQRSQSEIQIANQIRQKNQLIKQKKSQRKQMDKSKTLVRTKSSNPATTTSKGFIDVITLSLIVSFIVGAVSMLTYFLISR